MKETNQPDFYTLDQLDLLIELPISEIKELLTPSVKFKGLLFDKNSQPFYADGIFTINESKLTDPALNIEQLEMMSGGVEFDVETWNDLISVVGIPESNDKKLLGNKYSVKTKFQIDEVLYSYNCLSAPTKNYFFFVQF